MTTQKRGLTINSRYAFLSTVNYCFDVYRVDLTELGNDSIWGSMEGGGYRDLRPWSCCGGLPPDEEIEWHVHHIKNCLTYVGEMQEFCRQLIELIKRKAKELSNKKNQAIKRIKAKGAAKNCFDYSKHAEPINKCTNSQQLAEKEKKITQEIEQLSRQAQADETKRKKQEEENERLRKEEEVKWQKKQEEWEEKKWEKLRQQVKENNSLPYSEEQKRKEEKEFLYLISLVKDCQDLVTLEKNYQIVKNSPLYADSKETFVGHGGNNKTRLDNFYTARKSYLQSKHQKNNPSINVQGITQTENISEAITIFKNQVIQFLRIHNLETADLPKQYQNWEKQLKQCQNKDQINSLTQEINRQIEQRLRRLKREKNQKGNNRQQPVSLTTKLFISGGVVLMISVFLILMIRRKRFNKNTIKFR